MEEEIITPDLLPEEPQLSPADKDGAVSPEAQDKLTLDEINSILGKNFKDKESVLKSVKDTFSYVGKRKEDILKEVNTGSEQITKELSELKENLFFKDNPDYTPYRDLIRKMGSNPEVVTQSTEFKTIFEKAKGYDDSQKLKSVLVSNPRLAASKDNLTKAREAHQTGSYEEAAKLATQAVLDSLQ